ncbi:MAG: hypothetical protein B7Y02_14340 [Rhodobacterales bacterium 17-64-5]|nr:MAG: hypothetical protein B7Y02_14340 [Rhodobacterales bacterium 17-64-5]
MQVSTDFVFDGTSGRGYRPDDLRNPQSVYGASKAAGEDAAGDAAIIVRTSWVHAAGGANFVRTMLRLMRERENLSVVADQIGSPTWATGLAQVLWGLAAKDATGIWHHRDAGIASWYDFAVAIAEEAHALGLLARHEVAPVAAAHLGAGNMTEEVGTLAILLENGAGQAEVARFEQRWRGERLVMDKWFGLQILCAAPDQAAGVTEALTRHPLFDWKNPNRFRSVIGALSGNHAGFHHASGQGYRLLADWLIRLDPLNPQTAARMSTAFETWGRYDAARQGLIRAELARIAATPGLSRDLGEMAGRMLG